MLQKKTVIVNYKKQEHESSGIGGLTEKECEQEEKNMQESKNKLLKILKNFFRKEKINEIEWIFDESKHDTFRREEGKGLPIELEIWRNPNIFLMTAQDNGKLCGLNVYEYGYEYGDDIEYHILFRYLDNREKIFIPEKSKYIIKKGLTSGADFRRKQLTLIGFKKETFAKLIEHIGRRFELRKVEDKDDREILRFNELMELAIAENEWRAQQHEDF